jgi:hypothetical protein
LLLLLLLLLGPSPGLWLTCCGAYNGLGQGRVLVTGLEHFLFPGAHVDVGLDAFAARQALLQRYQRLPCAPVLVGGHILGRDA